MEAPDHVTDLVRRLGGNDPWFMMTKRLASSDLDLENQKRLLVPSRYVRDNLIPVLSGREQAKANLLHRAARRNMPAGRSRVRGREHGGLDVEVHARNGFRCCLNLTRWDSTGSTVIKGADYNLLLYQSSFQENDEVGLWGFRNGNGKLCFVLVKMAW